MHLTCMTARPVPVHGIIIVIDRNLSTGVFSGVRGADSLSLEASGCCRGAVMHGRLAGFAMVWRSVGDVRNT